MKIRNGLVSNSSCSSFIVHFRDSWFSKEKATQDPLISKEQEAILKKNGYKLTHLQHPTHLDNSDAKTETHWVTNKRSVGKMDPLSYAKWIICNQDDEIYTLVKNHIPFIASVHYGHYLYLYPRGSKYIYIFTNFGSEIETYHQSDTPEQLDKLITAWNKNHPTVSKQLVSDFIKQEEKIQKEYREFRKNENKTLPRK